MERMNVIKVVVTPQQPIEVKTQVKTTQVQIGTGAALGAVTQGVIDLHKKVDDLANKQVEVDLSPIAKEDTLTQGLSSVESKVEEVGNKIDNIKLPEIDTTELAKQGENQDATNSAIYEELMKLNGSYADQIKDIVGE